MITIRDLDRSSDDDLRAYASIDTLSDEATIGGSAPQSVDEVRASMIDDEFWLRRLQLAFRDGEPVACLVASMALQENTDRLQVFPVVLPEFADDEELHFALADRLAELCAETGRKATLWQLLPPDGDPDDPAHMASRVAARLGLTRRSLSTCSAASLPVPDDVLAKRVEEADGYRIELWRGPTEDRWVPALLDLYNRFDADMPTEDEEYERRDYTVERLRSGEARLAAQGIERLRAVAIAPDDTLVAITEVEIGPRGSLAYQEVTVVLTDHRGHGLGKAIKLATHAELSRIERLTSVATWTSHVNPWMNAINEALGYETRFREACYQ